MLLLSILLVLSFVSCGKPGKKNKLQKRNELKAIPQDQTVAVITKTGSLEFKVEQTQLLLDGILQVSYTIKNLSNNEIHLDMSSSYLLSMEPNDQNVKSTLKDPKAKTLKFTLQSGYTKKDKLLFLVDFPSPPFYIYFAFEKDKPLLTPVKCEGIS